MTTISKSDLYRLLPSVDELLHGSGLKRLIELEGQPAAAEAVRMVLASLREEISAGQLASAESVQTAIDGIADAIVRQLNAAMDTR